MSFWRQDSGNKKKQFFFERKEIKNMEIKKYDVFKYTINNKSFAVQNDRLTAIIGKCEGCIYNRDPDQRICRLAITNDTCWKLREN